VLPKDYHWDNVVSFIYPIMEPFYGGMFSNQDYINKFHITISEESKNFLGRYALLAHECAHALMISRREKERPKWFENATNYIYTDFLENCQNYFISELKNISKDCKCYNKCFTYKILNTVTNDNNVFSDLLEECIADLIAFSIGGMCTIRSLVDFSFNKPEIIIRISFFFGFLGKTAYELGFLSEIDKLFFSFEKYGDRLIDSKECKFSKICRDLLFILGHLLGLYFKTQNNDMIKSIIKEKTITKRKCEKYFEFTCKNEKCDFNCPSLLNNLIKEEYKIDDLTKIQRMLMKGEIISNEDPRRILDAFYYNVRQHKKSDYTSALYNVISLKFS